jgi:hypothetical protein
MLSISSETNLQTIEIAFNLNFLQHRTSSLVLKLKLFILISSLKLDLNDFMKR